MAVLPLYLSASDLRACLSDDEIGEVVAETLRGLDTPQVVKGPKAGFGVDIDGEHLHMGSVSGCVLTSSAAGIKWFVVSDRNPSRGLPRVPATIVVCDARTGLLEGVLDGTELTSDRTAAYAVVAASACAKRPLESAAVIGAGGIGRAVVRFMAATPSIDRIAVASRTFAGAQQACDAAAASLPSGVTLTAAADVRQAVHEADVVITATGITEDTDLVRARWLKDGVIVCTLGSRREVDAELISQAWIVVDDFDGLKGRRSEFAEGGLYSGRVAGDLRSLMSGALSPPEDGRWINVVLAGLGVLDVALGARAISNARRMGLGVRLEDSRRQAAGEV